MSEKASRNIDDIIRKDAGNSSDLGFTGQNSRLLFLEAETMPHSLLRTPDLAIAHSSASAGASSSTATGITPAAIRHIHALCKAWEDSVVEEKTSSTGKAKRFFRIRFSLAALVTVFVVTSLLLRFTGWHSLPTFWISFIPWCIKLFAAASIFHAAVAVLLFAKTSIEEDKKELQVFSARNSLEVEDELVFYSKLAQHPPEVTEYVAAWLEMRDAQMQNKLSWLKGSMAASSATLGVAIFGQGQLLAWFQTNIAPNWLFAAQILLLILCLALFIGLTTTWNCTASTANRALRLRHFLKSRDTFQSNISHAHPPASGASEST